MSPRCPVACGANRAQLHLAIPTGHGRIVRRDTGGADRALRRTTSFGIRASAAYNKLDMGILVRCRWKEAGDATGHKSAGSMLRLLWPLQ